MTVAQDCEDGVESANSTARAMQRQIKKRAKAAEKAAEGEKEGVHCRGVGRVGGGSATQCTCMTEAEQLGF